MSSQDSLQVSTSTTVPLPGSTRTACITNNKHNSLESLWHNLDLGSVLDSASTRMKLANLGFHHRRKTFNNKSALIQHLRSGNHNRRKFTCPSCLDRFDSLFALAAHVESPSRKCKINQEFDEKDMYRIFLDQLTLGMVEVGGLFSDCTQKFELQEEFKELYGPQKTSGPTFGHMQMRGSSGDNPATTGRPELTEAALSRHQQQMGKDCARSTPSGRQHDRGRSASGPEVALTADALSRLQLQEKRASPWGQRPEMNRQPQQRPAAQGQTTVPQQHGVGYVGQQLGALGWDTWDGRPRFREQDKDCRVNPEPSDSWGLPRKGGGSSGSGW